MTTLVTGGAKCGKSRFAEALLQNFDGEKFYIATMEPFGEEARAAIARHRNSRAGKGFRTIERYTDLKSVVLPLGCGVLLECTANLCANEMFRGEAVSDPAEWVMEGFCMLKSRAAELVIVTNDVGSDGIAYEAETAKYIRYLGNINRRAAALADRVVECVYGIPVPLKGTL